MVISLIEDTAIQAPTTASTIRTVIDRHSSLILYTLISPSQLTFAHIQQVWRSSQALATFPGQYQTGNAQ